MVNRRNSPDALDGSPMTAWTRIVQASDPGEQGCRKSLEELVAIYDHPLTVLFEKLVYDHHKAHDWKQDFVISHVLTGKIFSKANKNKGRFRTYLAVGVKNYVRNQWKKEGTRKRAPAEGASVFSAMESTDSEDAFEARLVGSEGGDSFEDTLTCERGKILIAQSFEKLEQWCKSQDDPYDLLGAVQEMRSNEDKVSQCARGAIAKVLKQFKNIFEELILEESDIEPGQNKQRVLEREMGVFFDALSKNDKGHIL
jgi:DNA-directed RNA polymerase specialized sigma24 family protein